MLEYMPFVEASCDGGKKAADANRGVRASLGQLPHTDFASKVWPPIRKGHQYAKKNIDSLNIAL